MGLEIDKNSAAITSFRILRLVMMATLHVVTVSSNNTCGHGLDRAETTRPTMRRPSR
ncbi:protein of unknown function [Bradyrhizobium vignae]|uniref:Uncharacterized protein n=1 Tax=Bradyrhizobium vignae TaxID=1549949 RepID=A0A2U3PUA6_9BRAD|nr:protein of unknown function [Bradyrhizobium vignae]